MNSPRPESRCPTHIIIGCDRTQSKTCFTSCYNSNSVTCRLKSARLQTPLLRHGPMVVRGFPSVRKMCNGCVQSRFHRSQRDFEDVADLFVRKLVKIGEQKNLPKML